MLATAAAEMTGFLYIGTGNWRNRQYNRLHSIICTADSRAPCFK